MQKVWSLLGAAAALASPLVSAQAATHGLVAPLKVSPVATTSLHEAAVRAFLPFALFAPPTDTATPFFGLNFNDLSPKQVNDSAFSFPAAGSAKVASATSASASGFDGISIHDQDVAGTGAYAGTQYGLEPPDQALAVGNGFVVEAVNNALAIFKTDGTLAAAPTPMNQFLALEPEYLRTTGTYGSQSLSDPRAYYDAQTKRFFVEEWSIGENPDGSLTGSSEINVAVSQTSDPTGNYSLYRFDTTMDPNDPNDFILPDFVQIGADANGFFMSINQFSLVSGNFVGPRILAVSKADMVAGAPTPIVSFSGGDLYNSPAGFTVYPAMTPMGGAYESAAGGTEYFLSSVFDTTANQLGLWAISNTSSLNTAKPSLTLTDTLINSQPFTQPSSAFQKAGPYPQGMADGSQEERLDSGDTRMTQVTYVLGHLYSAIETSFPGAPVHVNSGFTYFSVAPAVDPMGNVGGVVDRQKYAKVVGETLSYPSLGINSSGGAVITCALVGPDFYPSTAFLPLDSHLTATSVSISSLGVAPDDGFTGYPTDANGNPIPGAQGVARWGDYSQAQPDENGNMWLAQETISTKSNTVRPSFANWGTFITKVKPTSSFGYK